MKLVAVFLLAVVVSLAAGLAITALASAVIPCGNDKAGCGLGEAYRLVFVPFFAVLALIVFAIAAALRSQSRAVRMAMMGLFALPLLYLVFAVGADQNSGRSTKLADVIEWFQVAVAFCTVVAVQGGIVDYYLRHRASSHVQPV
jgi:hypothetical protein